jgi:hypothetical protein
VVWFALGVVNASTLPRHHVKPFSKSSLPAAQLARVVATGSNIDENVYLGEGPQAQSPA